MSIAPNQSVPESRAYLGRVSILRVESVLMIDIISKYPVWLLFLYQPPCIQVYTPRMSVVG